MNTIMKAIDVVEGFFAAINTGDFNEARQFMSDKHAYTGPMFSTSNPDAYFAKLAEFEMEFQVETQDLITAENAVTHLSLLKVVAPVQATIPCCEVFDIENEKIVRQRFYFDTRLFPEVP